jgi:hypothetical protein
LGRKENPGDFKERRKPAKLEIMENNYENEDRYMKAVKRVEEIKGFYGNLTAYIVVNVALMIINLATSPEYLWFFWPMLGWGIGVVFHGMKVFNYMPFLGREWEEKKMREFIEQEKRKKDQWQ